MRNTQSITDQSLDQSISVAGELISKAKTLFESQSRVSARLKGAKDMRRRHALLLKNLAIIAEISETLLKANSAISLCQRSTK